VDKRGRYHGSRDEIAASTRLQKKRVAGEKKAKRHHLEVITSVLNW